MTTKRKKAKKTKKKATFMQRVRHVGHVIIKALLAHKWLRWSTYGLVSVLAVLLYIVVVFRPIDHDLKRAGVSFSIKYAEELGVDWKEAFTATVEELNFNYLRLMSYWDSHEAERDVYNFDDLDWQMDMAAKNGAQVSLAVGLRQPRWPECHEPEWASQLDLDERVRELVEYVTIVADRYKDHEALRSYQLENEALNHWFGECNVHDRKQIRDQAEAELRAIKSVDQKHPVIMSLSDQHGFPVDRPTPDQYGYSVYRVVYNTQIVEGYFIYPTPVWYHRMRSAVIKNTKNRDILIHELQMEPWGPRATVDLSITEQNKSMSTEQMYRNINFARQIGLDEAYLWGAEWWYWRKTVLDDPGPWNTAKDIVTTINQGGEQSKFGRFD